MLALSGVNHNSHHVNIDSYVDMTPTDIPAMIPSDGGRASTKPTQLSKHADGTISSSKPTSSLPKLPVPKLEDSCRRYLRALQGLQDEEEHERTKAVVQDFLSSGEGAKWQTRLEEYNRGVDSYIEEFWCGFKQTR